MPDNPIRTMRSDMVKKGFARAPHRSLLRATGVIQSEDDWNRPFIAITNSYIDIIPGHAHLNVFGEVVCAAVRAAGGVPFMFNTIGVDDGIAMGHTGMKYSLPSRDDRRLGRDDDRRALLRRHDLHPQLRQDRAGDADGRHAAQHPDDLHQRRADDGRRDPFRQGGGPDLGLRGGGRISVGKIDDAGLANWSSSAVRRAARAPACSPPTR